MKLLVHVENAQVVLNNLDDLSLLSKEVVVVLRDVLEVAALGQANDHLKVVRIPFIYLVLNFLDLV